MMLLDLTFILQWWFPMAILGLAFLPLTTLIFSNFFDKGYIFSKVLGLILLSYTSWLLASLRILPFNTFSLFVLFLIFLTFNIYIARKYKTINLVSKNWKIFLFEEFLFFTCLTFWSFIRAHEPSIHGLEKYMDFGFINSILRSEYFPPKDLWLAPESINYYYFGHLMVAVLTKLSFLDPVITYNLMVATLFALTFTASFSLGANLVNLFQRQFQIILCGLLTAFLVTFAGNLHPIYAFFQNYNVDSPQPFWTLKPEFNFSGYWYPNATRFIPLTIHEFPIYSFVVSDLHGHALNIPLVLLVIALVILIFFKKEVHFGFYILMGLLIGCIIMTNVLDYPIYLLLLTLILFFKYKSRSFLLIAFIAILGFIFSLPFWLNFKPFGSGIGVLCAPQFLIDIGKIGPFLFEADHCSRSPFWMLAILWGFFYFAFYGFILKVNRKLNNLDNLILIFVLFSTLLILIPEIFYVKDIYPAHYRANTVFKFGFQAFIVLGLSTSYMIFRIYNNLRFSFPLILYSLFLILFFSLVAIYPYFAIRSYYGQLSSYKGLDGLLYLKDLYSSDYLSILWLKDNIKGQPVILEAVGESYTDYARVSANSGLPTIIGWPVHEWLWRGSPDEGTKRSEDVKLLYEDSDLEKTKNLIKKYNVSLVFVGTLERQKYPNLLETKFTNLGKVIYQNDQTKIYEILL